MCIAREWVHIVRLGRRLGSRVVVGVCVLESLFERVSGSSCGGAGMCERASACLNPRTGGKRLCARFRDCVRYCVRDIACNKSICVVSAVGLWFEGSFLEIVWVEFGEYMRCECI